LTVFLNSGCSTTARYLKSGDRSFALNRSTFWPWFRSPERFARNCHHPRRRVIQYSRDVSDRTAAPQRTGYSAFAEYDSRCVMACPTSSPTARSARRSAIRLRRSRPAAAPTSCRPS
jgi:hypothetical protein